MSAKMRLVRCPRCRRILPEWPNIPVYQCGGCGTHLQGKNITSTSSSLPETYVSETNISNHVSEGTALGYPSHKEILHSAAEFSVGQQNGRNRTDSSSCNGVKLADPNLTDKDENIGSNQNGCEDLNSQWFEEVNDVQKSEGNRHDLGVCDNDPVMTGLNLSVDIDNHRNEPMTCTVERHGICCSSNQLSYLVSEELPQSPSAQTCLEVEFNGKRYPLAAKVAVEGEAEADANYESDYNSKNLSQRELIHAGGIASFATTCSLAGERISLNILESSPAELLEQSGEIFHRGFARVWSMDTCETTDFASLSSAISNTVMDLSKSPTTRSSYAYCDDGVSSYEQTDDQLRDRHKHYLNHAYRLANNAASGGHPRKERFQADVWSSAPILPGLTHFAIKASKLDRDDLPEETRVERPLRNWSRAERDEYMSQRIFHRREVLAGYESAGPSPSNRMHNDPYHDSSFHAQEKPAYVEHEKMRLLRMVYDLQDQLNGTSSTHKVIEGVTWTNDRTPMYCKDEVLQEEIPCNLSCPGYSGMLREGSDWRQSKYPGIPFSAEATTSGHRVDHSLCFCSQDWRRSMQLHQLLLRHRKGHCRVHSLHSSFGSCPSSPQQYLDSESLTYGRETKSTDQNNRDQEAKYSREKIHSAKRHLRPIAGGAPFITCRGCLKQLQLPADFLLFNRKFNQLRCGACSEVLEYSLANRTHLVLHMPADESPPPGEIDVYSDATRRTNFTSTSYISYCPSPNSLSCSEAFTDRDPASLTHFHGNTVERNVSYSPLGQGKERKRLATNASESKGKNAVEAYESGGPSTTSARAGAASPLHRLMGYTSPRAMIDGWGTSDPETSSYQP